MIIFSEPPEVAEIRTRIADLKLDLDTQKFAPLSDAEASKRIEQMVQVHAATAQTDRIRSHLIHPAATLRVSWPPDGQGSTVAPSAFDLMCALDPKGTTKALKDLVAAGDHKRGPGTEERRRRIAELTAELHELEVEEERLIEAAESRGHQIHRRPEASPAIILGEIA